MVSDNKVKIDGIRIPKGKATILIICQKKLCPLSDTFSDRPTSNIDLNY